MRRRPSPSLLVAIAAVVIASTGTAVAATVITSSQIKDGTIQLSDLSAKAKKGLQGKTGAQGPAGPAGAQGNGAAAPLQGPAGATGARGPAGPAGEQGPAGAAGAAGTARAYGRIFADTVTFDPSFTKNLIAVTHVATGVYCITPDPAAGIDVTSTPAVATIDWDNTADPEGTASVMLRDPDTCGGGQFAVSTERSFLRETATGDTILDADDSDTVSFTILIP